MMKFTPRLVATRERGSAGTNPRAALRLVLESANVSVNVRACFVKYFVNMECSLSRLHELH
jgi:hypothetical protein